VKEHALQDRVRLLGKMPYERMMDFTRNADLGLTLDKDSNLNYRFSLPNKLFDYLHAGTPVLATDLPEVAAIVRQYDAGVVMHAPDPGRIATEVKTLMRDTGHLSRLRVNATFAARELDGGQEMNKLLAVLRNP
jgi:glycosyltransferase involved in cell wall biosynthesis